MKKTVLGFLLLSTIALHAEQQKDQVVSVQDLANELFGWSYLRDHLGSQLEEQKTAIHNVGALLHDHALLLALPSGAAGMTYGLFLSVKHLYKDFWAEGFKVFNRYEFLATAGFTMLSGTLCCFIAYKFFEIIGAWLEKQPQTCTQILKTFLSQWPVHKQYAPLVILPVFDALYLDLMSNNQNFTLITDQMAAMIVENILMTAVVASAVTGK